MSESQLTDNYKLEIEGLFENISQKLSKQVIADIEPKNERLIESIKSVDCNYRDLVNNNAHEFSEIQSKLSADFDELKKVSEDHKATFEDSIKSSTATIAGKLDEVQKELVSTSEEKILGVQSSLDEQIQAISNSLIELKAASESNKKSIESSTAEIAGKLDEVQNELAQNIDSNKNDMAENMVAIQKLLTNNSEEIMEAVSNNLIELKDASESNKNYIETSSAEIAKKLDEVQLLFKKSSQLTNHYHISLLIIQVIIMIILLLKLQ